MVLNMGKYYMIKNKFVHHVYLVKYWMDKLVHSALFHTIHSNDNKIPRSNSHLCEINLFNPSHAANLMVAAIAACVNASAGVIVSSVTTLPTKPNPQRCKI